MNIETYLNALVKAKTLDKYWLSDAIKRDRQYRAFRDRILMKFDAKEMLVQLQHMKISSQRERIAELEAQIKEMNDIYTLERILNND